MAQINKLLATFCVVLLLGFMASFVCAVVLNNVVGGRGVAMIPFVALFAVTVGYLAMSVTMIGKYPLWQVAGVLVLATALVLLPGKSGLIEEVTATGMIVFGMSSVPYSAMRLYGLVLACTHRRCTEVLECHPGETTARRNLQRAGNLHWRLSGLFSALTAIAVLLGSFRALFSYYPFDRIVQQFVEVNVEFGILVVIISLVYPLTLVGATSTDAAASIIARLGLLITLLLGVGVYRNIGCEWVIIVGTIGVPALCCIVSSQVLYHQGFRLVHCSVRTSE